MIEKHKHNWVRTIPAKIDTFFGCFYCGEKYCTVCGTHECTECGETKLLVKAVVEGPV
jgi:hypothetical protein